MTAGRKADRHPADGPKGVFARLDRDDDAWFRKHLGSAGLSVSEGVKRAVRAYRKQVENETTETTTGEQPDA
jgi:hypothetical protein